jgi:hypothetical protein
VSRLFSNKTSTSSVVAWYWLTAPVSL